MSVQSILYHSTLPSNLKTEYKANDVVDIRLSSNGRDIVGGSIRVLFDCEVVGQDINKNITYNGFTGGHVFFSRMDTQFSNIGQIESVPDYNRYVSTVGQASLTKDSLFNSLYTCEGRYPTDEMANWMLKGMIDVGSVESTTDVASRPLDFSIRPQICVNKLQGSSTISYEKTGDIILTLTLAPNTCLYGDNDIGKSILYNLKNLRVSFQSVPAAPKPAPMVMRLVAGDKQSLQSSFFSYSTSAPIVADSVFCSFIEQELEDSPAHNGMVCQRLPTIKQLQWLWNDSASNQIAYIIDNEQEIIDGFISAVSKVSGGPANCHENVLSSWNGFGIGCNFNQFVDLTKVKLSMNIQSGVQSTNPYAMSLWFSGLLTV